MPQTMRYYFVPPSPPFPAVAAGGPSIKLDCPVVVLVVVVAFGAIFRHEAALTQACIHKSAGAPKNAWHKAGFGSRGGGAPMGFDEPKLEVYQRGTCWCLLRASVGVSELPKPSGERICPHTNLRENSYCYKTGLVPFERSQNGG